MSTKLKERGIDAMSIIELLQSFAFPIVCCIAMGWYILKQTNVYREDVKEMQKEHKEEIAKMSEALQNNTEALLNNNLIIQRLCDKLEVNENESK